MQNHEINLAKSQLKTSKWRENVQSFIYSPRYEALPQEHKEAIRMQLQALDCLDAALIRRMELLGLPV